MELENPSDPDAREKPVVVLTAGEHPDEHSTYHVMKGALDFLTSDHQEAELLRQKATFLFVPVLDPDGLVKCMYENVCYSFSRKADFHPGTPTRTSLAYAKWFRQWANRSRLDTHILLHNVESGETSDHVFNYLIEPESARHQIHYEYWKHVANYLEKGGFHVDKSRPDTGMTPNRLGGFLRSLQGTMQLFLELNSQPKPPGHKLTLAQQQKLGRYLVASVVDYLYSSKSQELRNILRDERRIRWRYVDRYETILQKMEKFASKNALDREAAMVAMPSYERHHLQLQKGKDVGFEDREYDGIHWVRYMYNNYDISPSNFPGALQIDEK